MTTFLEPKKQVAGTNDCSIHSKYSIIAKGYVKDPFLSWFIDKKVTRSPIINRGYYVRHRALEYGFKRALSAQCANVVLSLGAGFDTSALRYPDAFFIELDYPEVCQRKAAKLLEKDQLEGKELFSLGGGDNGECNAILASSRYFIFGADLRNSDQVVQILKQTSLLSKSIGEFTAKHSTNSINFVLLNECSLCYIEEETATRLLRDIITALTSMFAQFKPSFTYLGYEMLRSQSCQNDFGDFLLGHFKSLGAGILTFITEDDIRRRFLDTLAFDELENVNMKQFWREQLNSDDEERTRVRSLEPFDEFEELDNVCASYSLTISRKRYSSDGLERPRTVEMSSEFNSDHQQQQPLQATNLYSDILPVFGHCSHFDAAQNRIQIFGGFGLEPTDSFDVHGQPMFQAATGGHRRYANIVELYLDRAAGTLSHVKVIRPESTSTINRCHSQVVRLESNSSFNTRFLLSGGRSSPTIIQPNVIVEIDHELGKYRLHSDADLNRCTSTLSLTPKAFRHVCLPFGAQSNKLVQFGGITGGQSIPRGTVFLYDVHRNAWVTQQIGGLNTDRHSMACTVYQNDSLLLSGGLDLSDNFPLDRPSALELIDSRTGHLDTLKLRHLEGLQSLYSHRLVQISDHEVLSIGGIGFRQIENVATRIDVRALDIVAQYRLQCSRPNMLLLHNFACELVPDSSRNYLCFLGGGGNCFSFGTHFNPTAFYDLPN